MPTLRFALAQQDFAVGAVSANADRVLELAATARGQGAGLLVCPELALCGYPPEDLLLRPGFLDACDAAMARIAKDCQGIEVLLGHPLRTAKPGHTPDECSSKPPLLNAASLLRDDTEKVRYAKQALPNYTVFDEKRYFTPGSEDRVIEIHGVRVGLLICEDIWVDAPAQAACDAGAELLLVINASPYCRGKRQERAEILQRQARTHGVGIAYLNLVGGQDDLLFDGSSLLVDGNGQLAAQAPAFIDALLRAEYDAERRCFAAFDWPTTSPQAEVAVLYDGLVRGIR
ncbi:MAG TPA: NAD+ synthase, partial [Mizugakiibacter sp.]|nr:NAD+ synthase [Mizugakiibacter sp.]